MVLNNPHLFAIANQIIMICFSLYSGQETKIDAAIKGLELLAGELKAMETPIINQEPLPLPPKQDSPPWQ